MVYAILSKNIFKSYGSFSALRSVDLAIPEGSIFGIIGTSGAGKTTLLKIFSTLEQADSGELYFFNEKISFQNVDLLKNLRSHLGVVFQNYQLLNSATVFENIALPLQLKGFSKEEITKKVEALLDLVGLLNKSSFYPSQLSGGQKQRVAIARALVTDPKILLCDEPTAALDPENTQGILELLKQINQTKHTTIVMISHEIGLLGSICTDLAIIDHGQVAETGSIEEVFFHPKKEATKKLLEPKIPNLHAFADLIDLPKHRIFQLRFNGQSAKSPVVSEIASRFNIHLNILQGNIDKVGKSNLGTLIVSIPNNHEHLDKAIMFLSEQQVSVIEL